MKHNFSIIIIFLSLDLSFSTLNFGEEVKEILNKISFDEREELSFLFHYLISDHFGYTLFDAKAVSLSGGAKQVSFEEILERRRASVFFWKWWQVWEKYQVRFKMPRFLLLKEQSQKFADLQWVILINKEKFIQEIREHQGIFNAILKRDVDSVVLLNEMEEGKISFQQAIGNNEILWGILLGYGKENSELFFKRDFLKRIISLGIINSELLQKYEDVIILLDKRLQPFGCNYFYPLRMHSVHCVADPNLEETKVLKAKYEKFHTVISQIYSKGDLLEISLLQLTSK